MDLVWSGGSITLEWGSCSERRARFIEDELERRLCRKGAVVRVVICKIRIAFVVLTDVMMIDMV